MSVMFDYSVAAVKHFVHFNCVKFDYLNNITFLFSYCVFKVH